jgi:uronate dehydrogenase
MLLLLTGAAGSVGKLVAPLLQQDHELRLADIQPLAGGFQGDLADPDFARRAVRGVDAVVHLAGLVASQVTFEDTLNSNYRAVLALLEGCRHENVRRFIFASSHHVQGLHSSQRTCYEATSLAPDGFYALSKAFGEAACAMYAHRFHIGTLVIRIGNADAQVADGRRERLWISARDLVQLIEIGLRAQDLRYDIVYGVSRCANGIFPNDNAKRLGYQPQDWAHENRAPDFRPLSTLAVEDGPALVGGRFAADPLPHPLTRLRDV